MSRLRTAAATLAATAGLVAGGVMAAPSASAAAPGAAQVTDVAAATASEVSILAVPPGCSGWIDWYAGRGRGHLNCAGSRSDVRVTVACGNGDVRRSAIGYEYARAECPTGLGAIRLSGAYV
ncbi:hypothetical protein ACGF5F_33220 [Streptomyces sp. NPDC047821]|uniref:hypothetical protein n=1 Tax=Streptomyces sp. NPDC047821 TaxID=3365488 RepID=UPI003720BD17